MVNILWTGGWDSTFRMIQLATQGREVQPYYVLDTERLSTIKEIKQIYEIRKDLIKKYPSCRINELKFINVSDIEIKDKHRLAFERLKSSSFIGSQYLWLAALSNTIPGLELSIHKDDKAEYYARRLVGGVVGGDSDENVIFGGFGFPILDYTKLEMEEEVKKTDDLATLYKSWFCHAPIRNTPCGFCNPCLYSIEEGMGKRFTLRGKIYSKFPAIPRFARRVVRRFI